MKGATFADLLPEERAVLRPRERLTVSQWADRHRVLDPINCAIPGPWRTDVTPHLRGIMDTYGDPRCRRMVLMGSTQWGKTEGSINMLLWSAVEDPAPVLFVLPTEEDVESFGTRRLRAAIEYCKPANDLRSGRKIDWKSSELALGGSVIYLGWANSPSRLASRSIGRVFLDEVDKYPEFSGKEADPISLATERLRWWSDGRAVISSTPRRKSDYIWREWEASDRRWFQCPCPKCGGWQPLRFSAESVRWPDGERDADKIERERLAWLVCEHCGAQIADDDEIRRGMWARGVWVPEGGTVDAAGNVHGVAIDGPVRGFHVNALYSPRLTWSQVAAQFLRSKDDRGKLMNFTNSWLGWPWAETSIETTPEHVRARVVSTPRSVAPQPTLVLTAGADVQKRGVYYAIRAHWPGEQSHTIETGLVPDLDQLELVVLERTFAVEDGSRELQVRLLCVDSGYETDSVYAFALRAPERIRPIKGYDVRMVPIQAFAVERNWRGRAGGLQLWALSTSYFKDRLARRFQTPIGTPGAWTVHAEPADEFLAHMVSEHRVLRRNKRSQAVQEVWEVRAGGGANHWWDCEVYNEAASDMLGLYAIRDEAVAARVAAAAARVQTNSPQASSPSRRPGWIRRRSR